MAITVAVIKKDLRISHSLLDDDIQSWIDSALTELKRVGVLETVAVAANDDPLILQAVKWFSRWMDNYEGKAQEYKNAFDEMKIALSLSSNYAFIPETDEDTEDEENEP